MNKTRASLTLVLLAVATLIQGCAAQWPNCPHRDNICNVARAQIHEHPERYKPDLIKREVIDVRWQGQKTGVTLEKR
jgi:hypothetical protein